VVGFLILIVVGALAVYALTAWILSVRDSEDSIYESGWGWLLPGGWFYKLGRGDDSPRERIWPYLFGGMLDGWLYNSGRERRRREIGDE